MALPYYIDQASVSQLGGLDFSLTPPATGLLNDIMVCTVSTADNVPLTFPAGWTIEYEANNGGTFRGTVAWKRHTGTEPLFTVTHPAGGNIRATVSLYRDCKITGSPVNAIAGQANASSTTCTAPTITTTVGECLLLFCQLSRGAGHTVESSANIGFLWERFDHNTTQASVSVATGPKNTAGATGVSTSTLGPGVLNIGVNLALAPEPGATGEPLTPGSVSGYDTFGVVSMSTGSLSGRVAILVVTVKDPFGAVTEPLYAIFNSNGNDAVPAPGTAMVQVGETVVMPDNTTVSMWMHVNPPSSFNGNATVYFPRRVYYNIGESIETGLHQTFPLAQVQTDQGSVTNPDVSKTLASTVSGNKVISVMGAALAPGQGTPTINAAFGTQRSNSVSSYANAGPYRVGITHRMQTSTGGDVTQSWDTNSASNVTTFPWGTIMAEFRAEGQPDPPPPTPDPDPTETPTACTLLAIQHRADHLSGGEGVHYASQLVNLGSTLGYAYAGKSVSPNLSTFGSPWNDIFFRTYDPVTQLFSSAVIVEPAAFFLDPAGRGTGEAVSTKGGSQWDKPNLVRLTDGRLILTWGRILGHDFPAFVATDRTIYGGGIYARESTDNGATWSPRVEVAGLLQDVGPMATDGTNVWMWSNQHSSDLDNKQFVTYNHYNAPTHTMRLYKRTGVGVWTSSVIYTGAISTRTLNPDGYSYSGADNGLEIYTTPYTNAVVLSSTLGLVLGLRRGAAATTAPLTGPGTVGSHTAIVCWRTTDGGTTWTETEILNTSSNQVLASGEGLSFRLRKTAGGRLYCVYKRVPLKLYIRNVGSSGAGNRTLTQTDGADTTALGFGETFVGSPIDSHIMLNEPAVIASIPTPVGPTTVATTGNDLTGAMVAGQVRVDSKEDIPNGVVYGRHAAMGVLYSDDNGATWEDGGYASPSVLNFNPELVRTLDYGVNGVTTMTVAPDGRAYIMGLNATDIPAISVWKSRLSVDKEHDVYDYFGCFGVPTDRVFGGWEQSDALVWSDGNVYELEQFSFNLAGSPNIGREELWIIGYPSGGTGGGEPEFGPTNPPLPFKRASLVFEGPRHPAGNPTIKRVGR